MRLWLVGLSAAVMVTGCDKLPWGDDDGNSGPSVPGTSTSGGVTSGDGPSTEGPGATSGQPPGTTSLTSGATSGFDTEGCGTEDTAADPWGEGDGCGGGLPTQPIHDVGDGGYCWRQSDRWDESCEEEPCLDYDCHSPTLCETVTFGDCDWEPSGTSDDGFSTTGDPDIEVDDPAALECILEALRDQVPITFTVVECDHWDTVTKRYEITSNGLVILTIEEASRHNTYHRREQEIGTVYEDADYTSCLGPGVTNDEKQWCLESVDNGPCPVGPVACPGA